MRVLFGIRLVLCINSLLISQFSHASLGAVGLALLGNYLAPQNLQNNFCCPRKERNFRASEVKDCANKKYLSIKETDELAWKIVTETLSKSHLHKETFKNEVLGTTENYKKQSNRLKTFRRRKSKLENEISDMKESIIRLETDKVLKKRSPEELEKIISGVEEHRLCLIRELEGLQSAIDGIFQV